MKRKSRQFDAAKTTVDEPKTRQQKKRPSRADTRRSRQSDESVVSHYAPRTARYSFGELEL